MFDYLPLFLPAYEPQSCFGWHIGEINIACSKHVYRIVSWLRISSALLVVGEEQLLKDLIDVFNCYF